MIHTSCSACWPCDACIDCDVVEPIEHRGSRALDADFRAAAASGFAPLTEEQREAFKEKLESMGAVIYGGRK